ncbi:hypothetical protein Taro_036078 [Colocasia esculenta]|uniref:Uncharacterized protein n=1 Tax=Colocasia esculenta TaxID=4460 RepID=A0A843W7G2_COLES|nr:hypothetical protein [Colocasia esculenta]
MVSKALVVLGFLLVAVVLISSEVAARELAENAEKTLSMTPSNMEAATPTPDVAILAAAIPDMVIPDAVIPDAVIPDAATRDVAADTDAAVAAIMAVASAAATRGRCPTSRPSPTTSLRRNSLLTSLTPNTVAWLSPLLTAPLLSQSRQRPLFVANSGLSWTTPNPVGSRPPPPPSSSRRGPPIFANLAVGFPNLCHPPRRRRPRRLAL